MEKILTLHSEEATLEDIFIKITGRGLKEWILKIFLF
jgi:hypothetical protein